ncbi:MAG: type II toxin-antitoxin system RelE/ParE family toxin [Bacteroidota bacterium]
MTLTWSDRALRRLEDAYEDALWISPAYARRISEGIIRTSELIEQFPRIGMSEGTVGGSDREVRSFPFGHYRIL